MSEPKISSQPIAEKKSSYRKWVEAERIPLMEGFFIEDIKQVPLEPWERKRGLGARICLEGTGETDDAYICEIPPGESLKFYSELVDIRLSFRAWITEDLETKVMPFEDALRQMGAKNIGLKGCRPGQTGRGW